MVWLISDRNATICKADAFYSNAFLFDLAESRPSEFDLNNKLWGPIIEAGKEPTATKVKDGHEKVILEVKTVISRIVAPSSFINPSSFAAPTLQICRLKADFITTSLVSPNKFITRRFCNRIRVPLQPHDAVQMKKLMQNLILLKEQVENLACLLKTEMNRFLDRRSSFENSLDSSPGPSYKIGLPRYNHWIDRDKEL
ncbi:hypothetical protein BDF21DRAFT_377541 [Thamnidium elegans]|uniref:Uncharacterized protein n=1 Tax=Thamnidium elegans TaxID=101142 RepID=A0A8H7VS99_9FUNG|nr:hypothetical protein INT48_001217 [Thamnidium elegans]KAI8090496.1 hypothetical protein BDF21DRAFT_377541 [Thamnidium elegans]